MDSINTSQNSELSSKSQESSELRFNEDEIPDEENYLLKESIEKEVDSGGKIDFACLHENELDLKQYPLTAGLEIVIENPLIVLKDRPYLPGNIEMDLG